MIPTLPNVEFPVPHGLSRVVELAYNMWWSWSQAGHDMWPALDQYEWERSRNPIEILMSLDRQRWLELEQLETVNERYRGAVADFDRYMKDRDTWYQRSGVELEGPVAYLCTEYGVHNSLPLYSGGLGILAGDHTKAASDLGLPFVGVGLLYRRGYFHQEIDLDGDQQHIYPSLDVRRLPIRPIASPSGGQLKVGVEFPHREVKVAAWKLDVGVSSLILLDTDIADNEVADRPITHQLYISGREMRFCQELVLGVGAVRVLDALGLEPSVWHVNEGHAAMSVIERLAQRVEAGGSFDSARQEIRDRTVFTLHTPVPAGNEVFDSGLAAKYLGPWAQRCGTDLDGLISLASAEEEASERFDLGALAIRFAKVVNGVSARHAQVVSNDWRHLIGGEAEAITNGVHTPTWIGREAGTQLTRRFGRSWPVRLLDDESLAEAGRQLDAVTIWRMHQDRKEIFSRFARGRIRRQLARTGASPDELRAVDAMLPTDRLTLGFARRFATYKRATLMFSDRERLHGLLTNPERPIQVVFAGKAHPADQHGQAFVREIIELSRSKDFKGYIYMLEDYDARAARFMVQGVDTWVNNPRPPMEASGTSGMKAAINGTLNLSVLDGWWLEGFNGKNGWAFGSPDSNGNWGEADYNDATSFYEVLAHDVAPLYYERDADGVPTEWVDRMKESMVSTIVAFSSHRMVADYCRLGYFPLGLG